ncbi:phage tail protein [Xenorhabdus bovienii]|uniref:phage baseplate protein n=1 Tax=Xenorhabdus bovienii TaxID=40576 RepID=UPI0023B2B37E|nr:phage tail protein [Xenorhabdus bovienii]MDE9565408.1 phage tail protein [Xenorhabdus bovienii]
MTKIFKIPFAAQGDRVSIPNEVQPDGAVSYIQGYGYDYERDQNTDPAAKDIEREKMNGIFHDITEAVGEMQTFGAAQWTIEAQPYPLRALVYHNQKLYQSRIENNKEDPQAGKGWVELKADLTATDVGAYNKEEANQRFQPLGNYTPAGYGYSKGESDTRFQPKGNYQPTGNYALKGESYIRSESDAKYQPKGNYQVTGDYATNATVNGKLDRSSIAQNTGQNTSLVMSQKAVTEALAKAVSIDVLYPIGIVLWFAQNKNPNSLFPGTEWHYIGENKTIRLASSNGSNILSTGGSDSITLSVTQLPAHNHSFSATTSSTGSHTHTRGSMNVTASWADGIENDVGASKASGAVRITSAGINGLSADWTWVKTSHHDFDASRSWTGETSSNGAHTHSVAGTTSSSGNGSTINITNAYIMLMGWYRIK